MQHEFSLAASPMQSSQLVRGEVLGVQSDGTVIVSAHDGHGDLLCDRLAIGQGLPVVLDAGDIVLICLPPSVDERGVVIGRIASRGLSDDPPSSIPEELLLEAEQSLTLKCGDGSITIRADGKILIKGKDLVSHAQRVNRIKGGSVAIN
jgi:hypothetical protein